MAHHVAICRKREHASILLPDLVILQQGNTAEMCWLGHASGSSSGPQGLPLVLPHTMLVDMPSL